MSISSSKLYAILLLSCMAGYIWLYVSAGANLTEIKSVEVCLVKRVTNIPCPSCGSTRSVLALARGNFSEALQLNPLGYVVAFIMIVTPIWILLDFLIKKRTFFDFYIKIETCMKKPKIAIPLVCLLIMNWIWNISKGL